MRQLVSKIIRAVPPSWLAFASENQWRVPRLRRMFAWGASLVKEQDAVIMHGVGEGLKFNAGRSHSAFILGTHETPIQNLIAAALQKGGVYYDVGANVGFFAVLAAHLLGSSGRVVCFEPMPDNVAHIERNARLNGFENRVSVRREALSNENTTATFLTSHEPTWGKLASVGKVPGRPSGDTQVSVARLDDLVEAQRLPVPDFMKIDIEGAEVGMLEGARETLTRSRPMIAMELHGTNEGVLDLLGSLNYDARAVGFTTPIREIAHEVYIIAAPRERADLVDLMERCSKVH
ncbi:MAG TPA: FkbM family methyltransferase [Polyangiaceae bacterium]